MFYVFRLLLGADYDKFVQDCELIGCMAVTKALSRAETDAYKFESGTRDSDTFGIPGFFLTIFLPQQARAFMVES
jgi:hypothetical protein